MSYADISTSSLELFPVLLSSPSAGSRVKVAAKAVALPQHQPRSRSAAVPLHEQALYLMLAVNFAVMVYGFISMIS